MRGEGWFDLNVRKEGDDVRNVGGGVVRVGGGTREVSGLGRGGQVGRGWWGGGGGGRVET